MMDNELDLSALISRPSWWVVKTIKWLAIGGFVLSIILGIVSAILSYVDSIVLGTNDETKETVVLSVGEFSSALAWEVAALVIYMFFLWLLAIAVDKLDQLVWLTASEEDRLYIYNQRQKK